MGAVAESAITLPTSVQEGLERLCTQLRDALGEHLVSVILYGGLSKGEYVPPTSNVNVMVVLTAVDVHLLDQIASPVQQGVRDFRLAIMVLSENDLRCSTDLFPSKFLDMQRHHHVLWGRDVLADLPIAKDHLRLRCKQELRNLLLRLRRAYLQRTHHTDLLEGTLAGAISALLSSLSVLLRLKAGDAPAAKGAIVETAAQELGLDAKPLREALALKSGNYKPEGAELRQLYDSFMSAVQKAADLADQL